MDFNKRPTVAAINLDNLRHNAKQLLAKLPEDQEAVAIVKANAYGHGAGMIARILNNSGFKKFGVATFAEGLELRKQGITGEIHIMDGLMATLDDYQSNRMYPFIYELEQLQEICSFVSREQREFTINLKFDTGMGRLGFSPSQVDDIIKYLLKTPLLKISSVVTHLAKADLPNDDTTERQYTLFAKLKDILIERGLTETKYSICNSAALIDGRFAAFDRVRPGIALYGCYPHARQQELIDLKPVLQLKTKIFSIKSFQPHAEIGYRGTFTTDRESRIAFLPIGYADGYPRLASNRGYTIIRGLKAPIVGLISMDLMAIDVTEIKDAALYDDVTLIGQDGSEQIRAEDVASWAETISYEILCGISARVPRLYENV